MEQARIDRDREIAGSEREIDALFRGLQRAAGEAVRRHAPGERMLPSARIAIMAEIDRSLDEVFGRYPGDDNAGLLRLVMRRQRRARAAAWRRSRDMARGMLG